LVITIVNISFSAVVAFAILLLLRYCCYPQTKTLAPQNYDSIVDVLKAQEKYIGIREIEYKASQDRAAKAEKAIRDRKPIYITRVERIVQSAPDTCQPYLIALKQECDTLQAKSDSLINELKNTVAKADTLIKGVVAKSETLEHFNDKLTAENKELVKDNVKEKRKGYFKGLWHGTLLGAAIKTTIDLLIPKQ